MVKFMTFWGLILGLAGLGSSCSHAPKTENKEVSRHERAQYLIQAAYGAYKEGDPTGALQHLVLAERDDPRNPDVYHVRSLALFAKNEIKAAIRASQEALKLKPNYSAANNALGKLYLESGRYSLAEKPLLLAAKDTLNREGYLARTNLGILYYKKGNYRQSRFHLDLAIKAAPARTCVAQYYLGHIDMRKKHFKKAIKRYQKATLRSCSAFADAHYALGVAFARSKKYKDARRKFVEISELFPQSKFADKAMKRLRQLP